LEDGVVGAEPTDSPDDPCHGVHAILSDGSFYYAGDSNFDLTSRLAERLAYAQSNLAACTPTSRLSADPEPQLHPPPTHLADLPCDSRFLYNAWLLQSLHNFRNTLSPSDRTLFDVRGFVVSVIQGFYGTREVSLGRGERGILTVVSRRGWARAGTRFNKRGIDRRGAVANFAEVSLTR
jgi:hypothetical protein